MADELAEQRAATTTQVDVSTSVTTGTTKKTYTPNPILTASGVYAGSGATVQLMHTREAAYYEHARDEYLTQNTFTVSSDIAALDRLLLFETQVHRWQGWLASGLDYDLADLDPAEERDLGRRLKDTAAMISQIQNDLGLTMQQRLKAQDASTVGAYLENLRLRAKEHGYHRDKQMGKSIELINDIISIAGSFKRSNENERIKLGFDSAEDVIDYILEVAAPQYAAIDEHYRTTNQKFWIRTL